MRVLVCGGRDYDDWNTLKEELQFRFAGAHRTLVIIHGSARGADSLASRWVTYANNTLHWDVKEEKYPADWKTHGKAAGPIRNQQMLKEGKPDLVIAFPGGRGTKDMVAKAKKAGINVIEVDK